MPGVAHETLVKMLQDDPGILARLLATLGLDPPRDLELGDSTARLTDPTEVRPDLILSTADGGWLIVEVQLRADAPKNRRWVLAAAVLLDQRRVMGDVLIITPHRRVAWWAQRVARLVGPLGTTLELEPLVLHLHDRHLPALLSTENPELAFFAAWAVHHRRGRRARRTVRRALELAHRLPAARRKPLTRAILNILSEPLLAYLREVDMNAEHWPESDAVRAWREELEARGQLRALSQALLSVLEHRGLSVSDELRTHVEQCHDPERLQSWLARAATAEHLDQVFEPSSTAPSGRR